MLPFRTLINGVVLKFMPVPRKLRASDQEPDTVESPHLGGLERPIKNLSPLGRGKEIGDRNGIWRSAVAVKTRTSKTGDIRRSCIVIRRCLLGSLV